MANILVVDDDDDIRKLFVNQLIRAGYNVSWACDGNEGLAKSTELKPNLIITDILMPKKNGLEMIRDLKKELPHIKIIAISGGGNLGPEGYLPFASKQGVDCTFTKPIAIEDLLEAVKVLVAS
jgi:CheY-like chemotaxis protein